jgi:outer membrane receptor protein involved in Fe transport
MRKIIMLCSLLAFSAVLQAQRPGGNGKPQMPSIGRLYGKIIELSSKAAVPYASVAIYDFAKDTLIDGGLTKGNGEFSLENLPFGRFKFKVKSLGYKTFEQTVTINPQSVEQDLGDISIQSNATDLGTTTVAAQKSAVQMGIDRKIFNVDKNIVSAGGTAKDVLKNVPSVTIDNDGNVLLRNSATQIYVDGRPTSLTIDQIPADQIDRIEIITNPSAKFDASTSGGILNLVMKRNTKPGYNGMVSTSIGSGYDLNAWGNRYNLLANLNIKQKKYNFSIAYTKNQTTNPNAKGYTHRIDYINGSSLLSNQNNVANFGMGMQFGRVGFDYYLNNRNTITLNYNYSEGKFKIGDAQTFDLANQSNIIYQYGSRNNLTTNRFYNHTSQANWKKTFPKQGKELVTDFNYIISHSNSLADYQTQNYKGDGTPDPSERQINTGNNNSNAYTFQMDYINPISDSIKIETGVRSYYKQMSSLLNVEVLNTGTNKMEYNPYISSNYAFYDMVNAAYFNYQRKLKKIGFQGGLRFEQSHFKGDPRNDSLTVFSYSYPGTGKNILKSLFPSVYFSKKLKHEQEWQVNYSRKINRPNYMQMTPFIMMADKVSYRIGNPRLAPEFINLAEVNYQKNWKKGSLLSSLYFKSIQNPLTNYSYRSPDNAMLLATTTINGKLQTSFGTDHTFKYTFIKKLEVTLNTNVFYTKISSDYAGQTYTSKGVNWMGKVIALYKLPKDISLQLSGNYESPKVIPQGKTKPQYGIDFGFLKEIYKKASINLTVNDIFNTRRNGAIYDTPDYYQELSRRRETRYVKLTLMYRFGKVDASIFKRKATKPSNSGGEGGMIDY